MEIIMKSFLAILTAAFVLTACGKKEEAPVPAKEDVTTKQDAQNVPPAAPTTEPAKAEEAKK